MFRLSLKFFKWFSARKYLKNVKIQNPPHSTTFIKKVKWKKSPRESLILKWIWKNFQKFHPKMSNQPKSPPNLRTKRLSRKLRIKVKIVISPLKRKVALGFTGENSYSQK